MEAPGDVPNRPIANYIVFCPMLKTALQFLVSGVLLLGALQCDGGRSDAREAALRLRDAKEKWRRRDVDAFRAWTSIPKDTAAGKEAARLLREADGQYLIGIAYLFDKKPGEAKEAFNEGARIAPIHPKHYLTLAKIYESERMQERAAKYYIKFAQALPDAEEAIAARAAARMVDPGFEGVFDPPNENPGPNHASAFWPVLVLAAGAGIGLLILLLMQRSIKGAGVSLARLIEQAPELHTAAAYLIGSLRHELLKHRIGVAGDVIKGLASGKTTFPQRVFLGERLYEGVPLEEAWRAHVEAFCRVLGPRFSPARDRAFRRAERAIRRIGRIKEPLYERSASAVRALFQAREALMDFDKRLAFLQSKLVRTRVDTPLLEQVAAEVRGEYAAGAVRLDDLFIEEGLPEAFVEIPRGDLVLVLKNILRNAVMAVDRNEADRLVGMGMRCELEPTGQEMVRIYVWDSSPYVPSEELDRARTPDSGLGLVMLAVKRYGGTVEIKESKGPYRKEAIVCFFRAFDDADSPGGNP